MYSHRSIAVDKGLGFDFSDIGNLVKTALPAGLQIFSQQMQLNAIRKNPTVGQPIYGGYQQPSVYGNQYGILPMSQALQPQPTFGTQYMQPSSGMDTSTMLMIGAAAVVGLLAYKMLR
jgi:hypothetical protein